MLDEEIRRTALRVLAEHGDIPENTLYTLAMTNMASPMDEAVAELEALRPAGSKPYDFSARIG